MKRISTFFAALLFAAFSFTASAQYTKLLDFAGNTNGQKPQFTTLISDGTYLYGMTQNGGIYANDGVIFKIKPNGTGYTKLFDFGFDTSGALPDGSLYYDGTYLYGMTAVNGANNLGSMFKIKPDGSSFTKLINFAGATNGSNPYGSVLSDGTFLYGMTSKGGANNMGVIFKIKPNGSSYTKLLDFAGATNGSTPDGSLIYDGTFLYGMTSSGGTSNDGVIFKIKPDGSAYAKLLDFTGANGQSPLTDLYYDGAYLYGMTKFGGTNADGVVFKIKPNGTGYTKLLDFAGATNGSNPDGSLILQGGFLYGIAGNGGANGNGTIFKIKPDGSSYADLLDFSSVVNGDFPGGSLFYDGTDFYGMAWKGGANNMGTIFKFHDSMPLGISDINDMNNQISVYPNPAKSSITIKSETELGLVTIYNSIGEVVYNEKVSSSQKQININRLPSGLYIYQVFTNEGLYMSSGKFVIQH